MSLFDLGPRARCCWAAVSNVTTRHFSCCHFVLNLERERIKAFKLDKKKSSIKYILLPMGDRLDGNDLITFTGNLLNAMQFFACSTGTRLIK